MLAHHLQFGMKMKLKQLLCYQFSTVLIFTCICVKSSDSLLCTAWIARCYWTWVAIHWKISRSQESSESKLSEYRPFPQEHWTWAVSTLDKDKSTWEFLQVLGILQQRIENDVIIVDCQQSLDVPWGSRIVVHCILVVHIIDGLVWVE